MTTPPDQPQSSGRTGRFWRYWPLIAAGFVTGIIFGLVQQPGKSGADWILIVAAGIAAILLWTKGIRRYAGRN